MIYKQSKCATLSGTLFKYPTNEYRAVPFWAWNCRLEVNILKEQIGYFHDMGFGGFNMHPRSGMKTEYLSEEYMSLVKTCVEEAKKKGMYAWLYDEDRWPSGFAGGFVTQNPEYRQRMLVFSQNAVDFCSYEESVETGKPFLYACYDIVLSKDGKLVSFREMCAEEDAKGTKWYAYIKTGSPSPTYNFQTYVDTMNKKAIDRFIELTHEKYYDTVGEYFGNIVPAIFTDEPQHVFIKPLAYGNGNEEPILAWTMDFDESFSKKYGYNIKKYLPELVWDRKDGTLPKIRYHYYNHVADRFAEAFTDNIGAWCDEHGIILTGHIMTEENLRLQTYRSGEVMRMYRGMKLPGVDNLMGRMEFNTLKQCQSAVHQYGREGMLSELYGVTNWDFDFRGHKFQGDWQAALGVTVRMHHLSWVSMEGAAKRDYPAPINYQSPWYSDYKYVEDHYARISAAMTRGVPECKIAVIHPMESYWLYCGTNEYTKAIRDRLDERHKCLTDWLLLNLIDFDFISEALLPEQYNENDGKGYVGCMYYTTVIVPSLETIRSTTLNILRKMAKNGVRVIFAGKIPELVDAEPSDEPAVFAAMCEQIDFDKVTIIDALKKERFVDIQTSAGERTKDLIYNLRADGDDLWLFVAHAVPHSTYPNLVDVPQKTDVTIVLNGEYQPLLYDTISGDIKEISFKIHSGKTYIPYTLYQLDSVLLRLKRPEIIEFNDKKEIFCGEHVFLPPDVKVVRQEPNVLLLDRASFSLDNSEMHPEENVLKIYSYCRKALQFPLSGAQPWAIKETREEHKLTLKFDVYSKICVNNALLAIERPEAAEISLNGTTISKKAVGYFTDKSIKTIRLPEIQKGKNVLTVTMPFGEATCVEACYILGEFDVNLKGRIAEITARTDEIGYGDIVPQGMPFYGGNITYKTSFELEKDGDVQIRANHYRGAALKVKLDGENLGIVAYAPYTVLKKNVSAGNHNLEITVLGTRVNTFGGVHNLSQSPWYGPEYWNTEGCEWSYEYVNLRKVGLLSAPVIEIQRYERKG